LLLFRLPDEFLLRFAERRLRGSLFHEPPRLTRCARGAPRLRQGLKPAITEDRVAQSPRIGMSSMGYPCRYTLFNVFAVYRPRTPLVSHAPQTVTKAAYALLRQTTLA
jgi:hypothetical protein